MRRTAQRSRTRRLERRRPRPCRRSSPTAGSAGCSRYEPRPGSAHHLAQHRSSSASRAAGFSTRMRWTLRFASDAVISARNIVWTVTTAWSGMVPSALRRPRWTGTHRLSRRRFEGGGTRRPASHDYDGLLDDVEHLGVFRPWRRRRSSGAESGHHDPRSAHRTARRPRSRARDGSVAQ